MTWDKKSLSAFALLFLTLAGQAARAGQAGMSLRAGAARLTLSLVSPGRFGVRLASPGVFAQGAPLAVEIVDARGAAAWLTGAYQGTRPSGGEIVCVGTLRTLAGTQFRFTDRYAPLPGIAAFTLTRDVQVATPAPRTRASRRALACPRSGRRRSPTTNSSCRASGTRTTPTSRPAHWPGA